MPCSCCTGTDVAAFCGGGYCPAEAQAEEFARQDAAEAEWLEAALEASVAIARFARAFSRFYCVVCEDRDEPCPSCLREERRAAEPKRCGFCRWSDKAHHPDCEVLRPPLRAYA